MPVPGEHKTVQARILHYAQEIGWTYVPRDEAKRARVSGHRGNEMICSYRPFSYEKSRSLGRQRHQWK